MRLIKMKCNNCNAPLDVDLDNLQAFCPYCGQKLMMDFDQLGWVLSEKEKTKRMSEREEHQTIRAKMAYEHKTKEDERDLKRMLIGIGSLTLLFVLVMISIYLGYNSDKKERLQKLEYLQQLEIEIEADIKTGDFDSALLNTNKLYCKDSCFSSEERAAWDAKREEYIIIIEEKKREVDLQDPNNIFMPASSNDFKGKKVDDVVDQLKGLGFTNITMQVASEDAGLFNKKDTVEHILIGGKTEFTSEDYFNKDTPIVVYYYSKE